MLAAALGFGIGTLIGSDAGESGTDGTGSTVGAGKTTTATNPDKKADSKDPGRKSGRQVGRPDSGSGASHEARRSGRPVLPRSTCPTDLSNCVVARGRVIYVEAVDPDGDGDAHFVTVSKENVTGAGLTVFDVRVDLRPEPLPGIGDIVGGAGPVYTGSHGQKQIEVIEFNVAR